MDKPLQNLKSRDLVPGRRTHCGWGGGGLRRDIREREGGGGEGAERNSVGEHAVSVVVERAGYPSK